MKKNNLHYDVVFQTETDSNNKGFNLTIEECKDYIKQYNGTNHSYFNDYKGGTVQIVCNETCEIIYEDKIL